MLIEIGEECKVNPAQVTRVHIHRTQGCVGSVRVDFIDGNCTSLVPQEENLDECFIRICNLLDQ